jgi:hypothetical protein
MQKKYECKSFLHDLKGNKYWTLIWRDGCELQLILSHNTYFDSIITFGTIKSSQTAQIIWLSKYLELKSSFNLLYKRIQKKNNNTTKSVMVFKFFGWPLLFSKPKRCWSSKFLGSSFLLLPCGFAEIELSSSFIWFLFLHGNWQKSFFSFFFVEHPFIFYLHPLANKDSFQSKLIAFVIFCQINF